MSWSLPEMYDAVFQEYQAMNSFMICMYTSGTGPGAVAQQLERDLGGDGR